MAKSNRERVGDVMEALRLGLGPFVLREYKMIFKTKEYLVELQDALRTGAYAMPAFKDADGAIQKVDVQGWLNAMSRRWEQVFRQKLGRSERAYVNELLDARNAWAHQQSFTIEDARRVADTATLLLKAANIPKYADTTHRIMRRLQRLQFEAEQKKVVKQPSTPDGVPTNTQKGLRPWRFVIDPHPDVANGRYVQAEFAADLAQVHDNEAEPEYQDPLEFFRRTYLTEGLLTLLANGVKRLDGQGGDPVVQLQTSFGGGKTHSMLALYHLFSGTIGISQIPGGEQILERVGEIDDKIEANRAVIVGTAFDANVPRQYEDVTTHTLWGEIAYQLGGVDGYKMMERADLSGVQPGSDTIRALLETYGPALIIIDELVAFARVLYESGRTPAGSFESVMTFMQALTEGVRRATDSLLLISIPESEIEVGGEGGKAALEILSNTIGRIESVWKPVTANESFEIVRRRLFNSELDDAARDAVVSAFQKMYARGRGEYPSGTSDGEYVERMRAAYPIHPELFDRLYQDWSTLERFQRTRGVLRFMASVIHQLWNDDDRSLMIMPGSIPLNSKRVRNEILRYLPDNWPAIVDVDIDGEGSRPYLADRDVPTLSKYAASRRVARAIFMGSAPSVAAQAVRGVEIVRLNLSVIQPGEPGAVFGDALRRMGNHLTYLYSDGSRYWYDTRPTVNRMAQDRVPNIAPDLLYEETLKRLKAVKFNRADFNAAHLVPSSSADVADEWRTRVVVLGTETCHKKGSDDSPALQFAQEILENRGNAPRLYRNMLVFIAPDKENANALEQALREYLAWRSIQDEQIQLNLDPQQQKQVKSSVERTEGTVIGRLRECYNWLIVPSQSEATGPIQWQAHRLTGSDHDTFYDRAMRKLRQSELLVTEWSPVLLNMELEAYLWSGEPHLGVKKLWEYLARYCYLSRLYDQDVLVDAIQQGVQRADAPFAYADSVSGEGYHGLRLGTTTTIYFNDESVIVRPDVAKQQMATDEAATAEAAAASATSGTTYQPGTQNGHTMKEHDDTSSMPAAEPVAVAMRRYYGAVSIDPQRVNKEVGIIVEEIIERLTSLTDSKVEITLEIKASRPDGFDEGTVRTVMENSRTLKFNGFGFEEN